MIETIYKHCVDRVTVAKEIVRDGQSGQPLSESGDDGQSGRYGVVSQQYRYTPYIKMSTPLALSTRPRHFVFLRFFRLL